MAVRLFVGNLSYDATEAELRELFSAVGPPTRIMVPVDRDTGRPRGFAFVEFPDRPVADEAIRRFNSHIFRGRPLAVSEARPREEGGASRPSTGYAPRPSSGFSPRPLDPGGASPPSARGERNFGPPAPPKGRQRAGSKRQPYKEKAKGPIREKTTGRFYDVGEEPGEDESLEIENFATGAPEDDVEE